MKVYRSRTDTRMFGLCGGLAREMGISAAPLRVGLVVGSFLTGGVLTGAYIIASMLVPQEPVYNGWYEPNPFAGAGYGHAGTQASYASRPAYPAAASPIDTMMLDLEEQAMRREVHALRQKLTSLEQNRLPIDVTASY